MKGIISLLVNGLFFYFYALNHDRILRFFGAESLLANIIIGFAFVIFFVISIFRVDIITVEKSWMTTFFLFWRKSHYRSEDTRVVLLFNIIPIHEMVVSSRHSFKVESDKELMKDFLEIISSIVPVLNNIISIIIRCNV